MRGNDALAQSFARRLHRPSRRYVPGSTPSCPLCIARIYEPVRKARAMSGFSEYNLSESPGGVGECPSGSSVASSPLGGRCHMLLYGSCQRAQALSVRAAILQVSFRRVLTRVYDIYRESVRYERLMATRLPLSHVLSPDARSLRVAPAAALSDVTRLARNPRCAIREGLPRAAIRALMLLMRRRLTIQAMRQQYSATCATPVQTPGKPSEPRT